MNVEWVAPISGRVRAALIPTAAYQDARPFGLMAGAPGLEPGFTDPKSGVLPIAPCPKDCETAGL